MKKNNDESISKFENDLKPFIDKRSECEKKLASLKDGLKVYESQRDDLQKQLNNLIRKSGDDLVEGKAVPDENIPRVKSELDTLSLIIEDIQNNAIPGASENIKTANAELASNLQRLIEPLRLEFTSQMDAKLNEAGSLANQWMKYVDVLIPGLNIQLHSWEREGLYRITSKPSFELARYLRNILGIRIVE